LPAASYDIGRLKAGSVALGRFLLFEILKKGTVESYEKNDKF
jgi:hypothetical protein